MYGYELQTFMLKDSYIKKHYGGVLALDELPKKKLLQKTVYIVNTDKSHKKGQHWVLLWIDEQPEYFDSFAQLPPKDIQDTLVKNGSMYLRNTQQIQPSQSATCGYYCLFYAYYRCHGVKMKDILQKFYYSCLKFNDLKVKMFYNRHK